MLTMLGCLCAACAGPAAPSDAVPPAAPPDPGAVALLVDEHVVPWRDAQVLSVDDADQRYEISLAASREIDGPAHTIALAMRGSRLLARSWGRDGDAAWFVFEATPAAARSFARAMGVPAHERAPWPGALSGRIEPVGDLRAGAQQLPFRFTLTNSGPVALWFLDGGRGRNELGRDNRFQFVIARHGERLATRDVIDFGGLGVYRRLEPGESWPLELDLAHWRRLDEAGQYTVQARYEAELMPAGYEPGKALPPGWYHHLQRTRTVAAEVGFDLH